MSSLGAAAWLRAIPFLLGVALLASIPTSATSAWSSPRPPWEAIHTSPGSVAGDRAALVPLYNATGGANWTNSSGWLTDAPIGQWHGVTTDSSGRVTGIEIQDNGLSGEIPAALGNLSRLTMLDLGLGPTVCDINGCRVVLINRLTGEIPAALGSLTNLEYLYLHGNRLTGEIPAELGSLANLTELFLNKNRLSGEIPEELETLINLEWLSFGDNRLTGCIPAGLRSIANSDLTELGIPYCDMLSGSPVVVIRFVSAAGVPVRLDTRIALEATFSEPVSGFAMEDIGVANGTAGNFAGSGAVYTFDVTPNAIGEVTVIIAAGAAEDTGGNGNRASMMPLGIPYDDDGDGGISKREAIAAIRDYFRGNITKAQTIAVIRLYFASLR